MIVDGYVVIQVTDSINDTVDGDAYVATDPSTGPADPRSPEIGEVVLNEFLAPPQTSFFVKWIELYNPTGDLLDIDGWLDDLIGAGSSPQQIPAGTILEPGGYYVYEISSYLNNIGDEVHLFSTDGTKVYDSYTNSSSSYDLAICRTPDDGVLSIDCIAIIGFTNG